MARPPLRKQISFLSNPWPTFFIFLLSNSLLSHSHLGIQAKLWIGLLGLFLPFLVALTVPKAPEPPLYSEETLPVFPLWVVAGLILAATVLRFYKWTTFSTWPLMDEGFYGFYAMELSEKWRWTLSYDSLKSPPLGFWCLGSLFKWGGPSLATLWFFPALLSALSLPVVYFCSRSYFSRSFSLILLCFWAFSFWPLYLGRLCLSHGLVLLWLPVTLAAFGFFTRGKSKPVREKRAALVSLCVALGFYTSPHWLAVAVLLGLAVLVILYRESGNRFRLLGMFLLPLVLALPILALYWPSQQGGYLLSVWAHQMPWFSWKGQIHQCWDYLSGLFWGVETTRFAYKPLWGGFLNSVETSLFLIGFLEIGRNLQTALNRWVFSGFFIFLLPGLLSNELEMLRVILVLPLLLWICALGVQRLLLSKFLVSRTWRGVALMVPAALLGVYHLMGPYQNVWRISDQISVNYTKSSSRWRAFQILSSMTRQQGPGLVLTEFDPTPFDQTLTIATYPFNAARNPALIPDQAKWAGLLTNINYAPFLSTRFPSARWFPLASGVSMENDVLVLGLIPIESDNQETLSHWLEMEKALHSMTSGIFRTPFNQPSPELLAKLLALRSSTHGDPFLESCVAERIFFTAMSNQKPAETLLALQRGLTRGYPAAHLYNDLGVFWSSQGDTSKARESFRAALHSPLNHTTALENLRRTPNP